MFKLQYKITDGDMARLNKSIMWKYFIPYLLASLVGIGVGIAATVLHPRTEILVFGIILIVLGAILFVCSLLLAILPKCFVVSVLLTGDELERELVFDDGGITVKTAEQDDIRISYGEIKKLQNKRTELIAYIGKEGALIIKDAITSGQTLDELYSFVSSKLSKTPAPAPTFNEMPKNESAESEKEESGPAEEIPESEATESANADAQN